MKSITINEVTDYVESNIKAFHLKRLQSLENLKLSKILKRKNPYLFKAKNLLIAEELIRTLINAHLSSQEETIFGDFLEDLAIFINSKVFGGVKSSAEGIDLEFSKDSIRYIVSIKSGPNWGNSGQIVKMKDNFKKAKKILRTNNAKIHVIAVNGCCYGRDNKPDKGEYFKYCGQRFWEFISGNPELYVKIIEPLGHKAKQRNDEFQEKYAQMINKFSYQFVQHFCVNGAIDWEALVSFNSSSIKPDRKFIKSLDNIQI